MVEKEQGDEEGKAEVVMEGERAGGVTEGEGLGKAEVAMEGEGLVRVEGRTRRQRMR